MPTQNFIFLLNLVVKSILPSSHYLPNMHTNALSLLALALLSSAHPISDGATFETDCNENEVGKACAAEVSIVDKLFETTTVEVNGKCIKIEAGRVFEKVSEF